MADLSIILPPGHISLYGYGSEAGVTGIYPDNTKFKFASIYGISQGGDINVYPGQSVMFNEQERAYVLFFNGWPYTIIEANKVSGIEIIPL
jgi:hypothetical protein